MDTPSTTSTETITVQGQAPAAKSHLWAGDHFSFHDLLDTINPLQHIPIVSTIYREVTGDTLGNAARVAGDALYGGVIGVIAGLLDVSVIEATGKDIGQNVMAAVIGDDDAKSDGAKPDDAKPPEVDTKTAAAETKPAATPAPAAPPKPAADPSPSEPSPSEAEVKPASGDGTPRAPFGIPLVQNQGQAQLMPLSTGPKLMPLNGQARSFAIDTSPEGILALKTTANSAPRPVPLNLPPGTLSPSTLSASTLPASTLPPAQRIPTTGAEFAQRMAEGLDKYKALVASRQAAAAGAAVDQVQ